MDEKLADCFLQTIYVISTDLIFNEEEPENMIFKLMELKHKRHPFLSCMANKKNYAALNVAFQNHRVYQFHAHFLQVSNLDRVQSSVKRTTRDQIQRMHFFINHTMLTFIIQTKNTITQEQIIFRKENSNVKETIRMDTTMCKQAY